MRGWRGRIRFQVQRVALGIALLVLPSSPVLAGEAEMANARKQFIQQALKNPAGARAAYQTSMAPARKQASKDSYRGLMRGIEKGREKVLSSMTARVARFFGDSGLISKQLLANWHAWPKVGSQGKAQGKAAGAKTTGRRSGVAPKGTDETRPSSGPALQYNGPKALDFSGNED